MWFLGRLEEKASFLGQDHEEVEWNWGIFGRKEMVGETGFQDIRKPSRKWVPYRNRLSPDSVVIFHPTVYQPPCSRFIHHGEITGLEFSGFPFSNRHQKISEKPVYSKVSGKLAARCYDFKKFIIPYYPCSKPPRTSESFKTELIS